MARMFDDLSVLDDAISKMQSATEEILDPQMADRLKAYELERQRIASSIR